MLSISDSSNDFNTHKKSNFNWLLVVIAALTKPSGFPVILNRTREKQYLVDLSKKNCLTQCKV